MFDNLEPKKKDAAAHIYLAIPDRIDDISQEEYERRKEEILREFGTEDQVEILAAVVNATVMDPDQFSLNDD